MSSGHIGMMHSCITHHNASLHHAKQDIPENAGMHDATRENIQRLMGEHGISSERQLALECNMSQTTLNRFLRSETAALDFVHIQSIAHHFGLTVSQLIGETPFDVDPKIRVVTLAMQQMPEYQKDVVVATSVALTQPSKDNGTNPG